MIHNKCSLSSILALDSRFIWCCFTLPFFSLVWFGLDVRFFFSSVLYCSFVRPCDIIRMECGFFSRAEMNTLHGHSVYATFMRYINKGTKIYSSRLHIAVEWTTFCYSMIEVRATGCVLLIQFLIFARNFSVQQYIPSYTFPEQFKCRMKNEMNE